MKIKKWILLLFTVVLFLLLFAACSEDVTENDSKENLDNITDEGMPIVEEPITLEMFATQQRIPADWNDFYIWNEYEEMTNINVEWEQAPGEAVEEKRNLALASGDLPDAFYISSIPTVDIFKYGKQGTFIKLNDLIEEHAPNLTKLMEENPEIRKGMTFPGGNIYSLPSIVSPEYLSFRVSSRPYVNQEWLDTLGMEMPETTEEFYQYLKAVKEKDPNGNGKADEIPYGGTGMGDLIGWLKGSFGIGNKGVRNANIDLNTEEDNVRFFPITDGYKEMLEYVNKLYSEKLIEQNIFTIEWNQYLANASEGVYGSTVFYDPVELFGEEAGKEFNSGHALEGPNGDKAFIKVAPTVASISNFAITNENENPAATVRWLDYFYSEEGTRFFYMGVEGETYEKTSDGKFEYVDKIKNSPDGLTMEQEAAKYFAWIGGFVGIVDAKYYKGSESTPSSIEAAEKLEPYIPEELWAGFTYTEEENKTLSALGSDIDKYVQEMQDKFITGEVAFSEWDNYVETIKDMGLDEYMEIQQAAYVRYKEY
ncbi:ABC transporter substrate-binding protein [Virgibacillus profundi]|uniref:ABC transporter substrate-binding protein n=1 Tax=Virgibacillus profundi TaxID=2024555 RepID=A0A2A2IGT3_9BACI|nr:extracellular solute-binding protein [Virgibacillus profundi]PAV30969.1 ABC transporter substrate-binding protein [Virgibacillus profundi]PXY55153.1 ABC transporter substrate-binding protein [Virgibacillus profundi]